LLNSAAALDGFSAYVLHLREIVQCEGDIEGIRVFAGFKDAQNLVKQDVGLPAASLLQSHCAETVERACQGIALLTEGALSESAGRPIVLFSVGEAMLVLEKVGETHMYAISRLLLIGLPFRRRQCL